MPYLLVRESFMSGCCLVDGLPLTEFRILGEKCSTLPDMRDEKNRRMEFSTNTISILNSLEMMGYKGLNHNEVRSISEKVQEQPEYTSKKEKRVEFSVPSWMVLNGLEVMGYKVVLCGPYMTGEQRHDQKEFVWTMYKNKEEWENSSK